MNQRIPKIKFLFILSFLIFFYGNYFKLHAQENTSEIMVNAPSKKTKTWTVCDDEFSKIFRINLSFSGFGLSLDIPASKTFSIETEIGLGASYNINQNFGYYFKFSDPSFYGSLFGKYYYNLKNQDISTQRHSKANYWGFKAKYASKSIIDHRHSNTLFFATNWGIQRHIYSNFYFNLIMGVGSAVCLAKHSYYRFTLYPDFNIKISYAFPLKSKN